ncbi:expressed unknown protein [Seminavis robusta]|uniref:Uncharacterized protein n=1 Tax=Seminavis robusta TaxID=568900 RepID=A0A9N8H9L9_9STRA|nr:expressed unknown protein [Seminavis robusta]|eukprot:Sro259_g101460.1 n/a (1024) ;mRNA; f:71055-74230
MTQPRSSEQLRTNTAASAGNITSTASSPPSTKEQKDQTKLETKKPKKKVPVTLHMVTSNDDDSTGNSSTSIRIPAWLKMYFLWHKTALSQINESNWQQHRFLVMTCFHGMRCGGVTDRLRPILPMLRAAHQSKRILLIYWERPFPLEEFLLPPEGGLDWRVPEYMIPQIKQNGPSTHFASYHNKRNPKPILNTLYQSWNYGWLWYNEQLEDDEPSALEMFKQVWTQHLFQMSPPVQQLYEKVFDSLQLQPGQFATAHIRALYGLEKRPHVETIALVRNAMNCASNLRPGGPFLVASDLLDALHEAEKYGYEKNVTVVAPNYQKEPLHIGLHNESDKSVTPTDFYSVFVDIYLLAQSRCVAVGPGGFGHWAQIMGYDHKCWIRHSGERSQNCEWKQPEQQQLTIDQPKEPQLAIRTVAPPPSPAAKTEEDLEVMIAVKEVETKKLAIGQLEKRLAEMKQELLEAAQQLVDVKSSTGAPSTTGARTMKRKESSEGERESSTATTTGSLSFMKALKETLLEAQAVARDTKQLHYPRSTLTKLPERSRVVNDATATNTTKDKNQMLRVSYALKQKLAKSIRGRQTPSTTLQHGGLVEDDNDNDDDTSEDTSVAEQHVSLVEDHFDDDIEGEDDTSPTSSEMSTTGVFNDYVAMNPNRDNLWDDSSTMPGWMKQYFLWHREQRAALTPDNFREQRFIIMTCLRGAKCGGMTDRLRPILAYLQVAHLTSRLFFIYWERPFPLEEFLLPPEGGMDWRMPKFLLPELYKTQRTGNLELRFYQKPEPMIMSTTFQSWHYGEQSYNQNKANDEPEAINVFRDAWNVMFTPSPPVAGMIANSFDQLGIVPGQYSTAHIRALYGIEARGEREITVLVKNALNCLSQIDQSGGPYLVAADTSVAIHIAKQYGSFRNVTVVSPPHGEHPLHLGLHNESDTSVVPANFYSIFNDMYLIAETKCTVVGRGGFGRWGILLGHEPSCNKFSSGFKAETCGWKDSAPRATEEMEEEALQQNQHHRVHAKMPFRKPMRGAVQR